jgi:hypothetical protein
MTFDERLAEALDKLKAEHCTDGRELHRLNACGESAVVRFGSPDEVEQLLEDCAIPIKRSAALRRFFRDCCVFPPAAEVDVMLKRRAGLAQTFGAKCGEFIGLTERVEAEKL